MSDPTVPTRQKPHWQERWLKVFRETGNVRRACEACGIHRSTAYDCREVDPEFREAWNHAKEDAADALELVALKRAKKSSDLLLIFLLKGLRPEVYREQTTIDVNLRRMSDEQLISRVTLLLNGDGEEGSDPPALPAATE